MGVPVRKHINRMDFKVMNRVHVCVCLHTHTYKHQGKAT